MSGLSILGGDDDGGHSRDDGRRESRASHRHRRRPPKRRSPLGVVLSLAVIAVLVLGVVYGARAIWDRAGGVPDYSGAGTGAVLVTVKDGDTASDIAATLQNAGVVKSSRAFRDAAQDDSRSRSIQPGSYRLRHKMSGAAALALMLDPSSRAGRITVPEGLTVKQVLALVADKTKIPLADLQAAAAKPADLGLPDFAGGKLEGYLFPSTYDVPDGMTATALLKSMVDRFKKEVDGTSLSLSAGGQQLGPAQIIIVASLLEKEGITTDFTKISRVVYNRLDQGMPLQFDSTINYALGRNQARVSEDQTQIDSPYNTYRNTGLPPGAIANPGLEAISAALHPAKGNWIYFIKADRAGNSFFTADHDAFLRQKEKSQAEGVY